MRQFNVSYLEVVKGNNVLSKYYRSEQTQYGSIGKAGKQATPELFGALVKDMVMPKVVHLDGNKVTKVSTTLLDGFDCYYGTSDDGTIYVCFTTGDIPKILPLRILTELKSMKNETDKQLKENIELIIRQFHEELLSYHDPGPSEATDQDLQDIIQIMNDNIDKFLQRQERVSLLVDRTSKLNQSSYNFKRKAVRIKTKMWWQNIKLCATLALVGFILVFLIWVVVHFA